MRASARTPDTAYDADEAYAHAELLAGERVGPPLASRRGKIIRRTVYLIVIAAGAGWALTTDRTAWPDWASVEATVSSLMNRIAPSAAETAAMARAAVSKPAPIEPPAKQAAADALPPIVQGPAVPPVVTTAAIPPPPPAREDAPQAAEPLPPPATDPSDPYRKRAEAVGLHPDLSRVLLDRLSPADYRNAAYAVDTALAKTPDDAVFVWPRQRTSELALFQVRFVAGAAPNCRRYVVMITKDGWLTTALPMERCGAQVKRAQRE
jgi:hypothetical protein